jgi:hypothetical protein
MSSIMRLVLQCHARHRSMAEHAVHSPSRDVDVA